MKQLQIISTFSTLAAAVTAAELDLSYNLQHAQQKIRNHDTPPPNDLARGFSGTQKAFILAGDKVGEVWTVYVADGIRWLRKFEPFFGVLSDAALQVAGLDEANGVVHVVELNLPNNKEGRKVARDMCKEFPGCVIM